MDTTITTRGGNQSNGFVNVLHSFGVVLLCLCDTLFVLGGDSQAVVSVCAEQPSVQILLVQLVNDVVTVNDRALEVAQTTALDGACKLDRPNGNSIVVCTYVESMIKCRGPF